MSNLAQQMHERSMASIRASKMYIDALAKIQAASDSSCFYLMFGSDWGGSSEIDDGAILALQGDGFTVTKSKLEYGGIRVTVEWKSKAETT